MARRTISVPTPTGAHLTLGTLGARGIATVDSRGLLTMIDRGIDVEWMVGAETWRTVVLDSATRQSINDAAPIVTTRIAGAGGDVVQRLYGVSGQPEQIVCEFENAGKEPVSLAVLLRAAPGIRLREFSATASVLTIDGHEVLGTNRPWAQWVIAHDELSLREAVTQHATQAGPLERTKMKSQRNGCVALVWPLPHTATLRIVLPLAPGPHARINVAAIDVLPDNEAVDRGWDTQLDRAMRTELSDANLQRAIDGARASVLLRSSADSPRPVADDAISLEDWGFSAEAEAVWKRLSVRDRRAASIRLKNSVSGWVRMKTHLVTAAGGVPAHAAKFLAAVRDVLIEECSDGSIDLLPGFDVEWLGASVAVHEVPTRVGTVSFAVRWHGGRPAVLWDAPAGITLRASRLDPSWSVATEGAGEQLLAEPSGDLLAMQPVERLGERVEEPGSFL